MQGVWCQVQCLHLEEDGEGLTVTSWSKTGGKSKGEQKLEAIWKSNFPVGKADYVTRSTSHLSVIQLAQWDHRASSSCTQTSVTLSHQNVPRDFMIIWIKKKWAHTASPQQQPNDKQLSLMCFPSMSGWIVKVNPWCLSVSWAYYVSASGCKGRRGVRKGRREEGKEGKVKQSSCLCSADECHSLIFTNNGLTHRLCFNVIVHKLTELWLKYLWRYSSQVVQKTVDVFFCKFCLSEILCYWLLSSVSFNWLPSVPPFFTLSGKFECADREGWDCNHGDRVEDGSLSDQLGVRG